MNYLGSILLKFQCRFRKAYNPQHSLLLTIDKWNKAVDSNKVFGAVLTDLSRAFDCVCHELFIAKLNAYGLPAFKLIKDYLQNTKQSLKLKQSRPTVLGKILLQEFQEDQC